MRTVLLHATKADDTFALLTVAALERVLATDGTAPAIINVADKKIADCCGCFHCWTKTPGACVIKDDAPAITAQMGCAERIVFCTPVVFGGFHPDVKRVVERSIALLLPFIRTYNGEMHHWTRYPTRYLLCAIGLLNQEDPDSSAAFRQRLSRMALNFNGSHYCAGTIVRSELPAESELADILARRIAL